MKRDIARTEGEAISVRQTNSQEDIYLRERELRLLFLELLCASYEKAIKDGYLDVRIYNGFVYFTFSQSL